MAIATITKSPTTDPLDEGYFIRAAQALDVHCANPAHNCSACGSAWPCAKALAAAFMLDLHTTDTA